MILRVAPGDLGTVVRSDGLSDMLDDATIAHIAGLPLSLEDKAGALVDAANAKGGKDNISALLVEAAALRAAVTKDSKQAFCSKRRSCPNWSFL